MFSIPALSNPIFLRRFMKKCHAASDFHELPATPQV
jgi:hypothetical protein